MIPSRWRRDGGTGRLPDVAAIAILLGIAGMGLTATPADAQQDVQDDRVRLSVSSLTGVLGPGSVEPPREDDRDPQTLVEPTTTLDIRVLVHNRGSDGQPALRLVTEVHPAVGSRSELRQALGGTLLTDPLVVRDPAIRDGRALASGEIAGIVQTLERSEVAWAEDGGVHPVRIAVTRGTRVLDEVVTAVVWLANRPPAPLQTVFVWPLDEAPWREAGGEYEAGSDSSIRTGERLDELVRALERSPGAPVVLAPAPHLLEDLRDRANGFVLRERLDGGSVETRTIQPEDDEARLANDALRRIREVAASLPHAPVSGTYASADLSALHATGDQTSRELASRTATMARQRLQVELDRAPDGAVHLLDGPVTPPVLDLLPGDQLLLPYAATDQPPPQSEPDLEEPLHTLRSPAGRSLIAMVADPHLTELLSRPDTTAGPVVAAQRIIAETGMIHFEAPSARGRSLLLLPEPGWDPGLDVADRTLEVLEEALWLDLVAPGTAFAGGRHAAEELTFRAPDPPSFPDGFANELDTALTELEAARTALPAGETTLGGRLPSDLEDALARAASTWLRSEDRAAAQTRVRDVQRAIDDRFGEVRVSESSVTLTSDSGQVPVTLQRTRGGPVALQVEVTSQGRLVWPDGRRSETLTLEEDGSTTVTFATEALSTGTFPVTVRVTDPSGTVEVARTTLSVRSTTISGPALTGITALVVVLLLVGGLRRRSGAPGLALVADPDGRAEPPDPPYSGGGDGEEAR